MALTIARVAAFITVVAAGVVPKGHKYIPPGPGDVRSPCPGLNSAANHGYLPRNGKNMTVPTLITGLAGALNIGADFSTLVGGLGIQSNPDPLATSFDLDMLDEHNFPIEHDGSLSRNDAYFGNDYSFNQKIFNQILKFYKGMENATIPVASAARAKRIETARALNPTFIYGPRQLVFSAGETALYLSTMGDPVTGVAPLSYVKSLFEKQELPYKLGWTPPAIPVTFATLGAMIAQIQAADPNAVPEGLSLGEGSLREVVQLINPLTGKAENITCILDGSC